MLDDMCDFELKEVVEDTDKKGYSEHYFTINSCRSPECSCCALFIHTDPKDAS